MKESIGQIGARFAEVAKHFKGEKAFLTQEEFEKEGVGIFVRKAKIVGPFFRKERTLSVDELATILTELKVIDSMDNGRIFIQELYGKELNYGTDPNPESLTFTQVHNKEGQEACRIKYSCWYPYY